MNQGAGRTLMAKQAQSFWTAGKLRELIAMSKRRPIAQIAAYYERSEDEIEQAIRYAVNAKRLKRETKTETINGKKVTVITFAAEWAIEAREPVLLGAGREYF